MVYLFVAANKLRSKVLNLRGEVFIEAGILSIITGIFHDRLPVVLDIIIRNEDKPSSLCVFSIELARFNPSADSPLVYIEMFCRLLG